eukprot:COSAG01_NODE_4424_length_5036_cov_12.613936_1_plen_159_part_00
MDLHAPILPAPAEIDSDTPTTEDIAQQQTEIDKLYRTLVAVCQAAWSPCQSANGPRAPSQHVPVHCWKTAAKPWNLELISEATGLGLQPACCGLKPAAGLTAAYYTVQIRMRNAQYRSFSAAIDLYQIRRDYYAYTYYDSHYTPPNPRHRPSSWPRSC